MQKILFIVFCFCSLSVSAHHDTDTIRLYFDLNIRTLNKHSQAKIDSLIYNDIIQPKDNVIIVGYADYLGSEKYNQGLSEARAKNVEAYLISYGIDTSHIKLCIGKGKIERQGLTDASGYPADRKVDIVLERRSNTKITNKEKPSFKPKVIQTTTDLSQITRYQPGQAFVLRNIYFPAQSHNIQASLPVLDQLYNVMAANPKLKIQVEGHVCCILGYPDAYDMDTHDNTLSVNRAKAIYDYLIRRGISPARLRYVGYGKRHPVVQYERNEEDAEKNRRVEIRILEK